LGTCFAVLWMDSNEQVRPKGGAAWAGWAVAGLAVGILIGLLAGWARWGWTSRSIPRQILDPPVIVHEIQRLNELVTVKYTVQKVVGLEAKKQPLGLEKLLLFVQADVLAGVDLSKVTQSDLTLLPNGRIHIRLPAPQIVSIVIDDQQTKVWDRQITWWTPWVPFDRDLERQARLKARETIEQAAIEGGILDQARRNAESAVRSLLETLGLKVAVDEHSTSTFLVWPEMDLVAWTRS
jgi:hypothetical protein